MTVFHNSMILALTLTLTLTPPLTLTLLLNLFISPIGDTNHLAYTVGVRRCYVHKIRGRSFAKALCPRITRGRRP